MSSKGVMELGGSRRRGHGPKAGSVWESRMKLDQVRGGIKVFEANHDISEQNHSTTTTPVSSPDPPLQMGKIGTNVTPKLSSGKRKTWKSEGSPVQIVKQISEVSRNLDDRFKESSISTDSVKSNPKSRSIQFQKEDKSTDEKQAVPLMKMKSETEDDDSRKVNSEPTKNFDETSIGNLKKLTSIHSVNGETAVESNDTGKCNVDNSIDGEIVANEPSKAIEARRIEKSPIKVQKSRSVENCKEVGVCEEKKAIASNNVDLIKVTSGDDFVNGGSETSLVDIGQGKDKEIEILKNNHDIKEVTSQEKKPKKIVIEEKKLVHNPKPVPTSPFVRKQPRSHPIPGETIPSSDNFEAIPRTRNKLQGFVDLVMWKDVSKSALVFGIGIFVIISSSHSKNLNISFISVFSYLGLIYLAANFLYRSFISRDSMEKDSPNQNYVVGEEEAIYFVKLILPYVNEFLLQLRALFSGDPATTMKMSVLLFISGRCGSFITVGTMTKLGFVGVFTVPKVSSQLTAYGTFWIRRFRDAWESCSHKKAVGFGLFTVVWNLSSIPARIWAVFMLFVGLKYYQQQSCREGWGKEEDTNGENCCQDEGERQTRSKQNKVC